MRQVLASSVYSASLQDSGGQDGHPHGHPCFATHDLPYLCHCPRRPRVTSPAPSPPPPPTISFPLPPGTRAWSSLTLSTERWSGHTSSMFPPPTMGNPLTLFILLLSLLPLLPPLPLPLQVCSVLLYRGGAPAPPPRLPWMDVLCTGDIGYPAICSLPCFGIIFGMLQRILGPEPDGHGVAVPPGG